MRRDQIPGAGVADDAAQAARRAVRSPWMERLARIGYAAKGVVYIIVGVLAAMAATGTGGRVTDSRGALQTIIGGPFGQVLLGIVAVGLIGYALWKFVQALADAEGKGSDPKGIAMRAGYLISGVIHLALAYTAARLVFGSSGSGGRGGSDGSAQEWTASLMAQPFGQWLVALVGAIIVGVGIAQLYKAYTAKFQEKLKTNEMSQTERTWTLRGGRLGFAARGVVFGVIGYLLIRAALEYDPSQAQGLGGALRSIAGGPFGTPLLAIVAAGLAAYGLFMLIAARYRHIATH